MVWTAALAGLIIDVVTGFNLYGGGASAAPLERPCGALWPSLCQSSELNDLALLE